MPLKSKLIWTIIVSLFIGVFQFTYAQSNATAPAKKVYDDVSKSVFTIFSVDKENETKIALGSAVAIDDHLLATNCHVALAGSFLIVEVNDKSYLGRLYYYKQAKDLCIVEIVGTTLTPVKIRPSKSVNIGEEVYAIGNPEGRMKTISGGIISNKLKKNGMEMLQTDAAISHGSSGGGLFDKDSNLIGLTTSGDPDGENIGFAIPTELILEVIEPEKKSTVSQIDKQPVAEEASASVEQPKFDTVSKNFEASDVDLIGYYGESKIGLFHWSNKCFITITGRYRPDQATSLAIWFYENPNGLFIFPSTTAINEAIKLMHKIHQTEKIQYISSKSYLMLDSQLYDLTLVAKNNINFPLYIFEIKSGLTEKFVVADYFLGQIYHFKGQSGLTTIKFGLDGFTEALAAYNKLCNTKK